MPLPSAFTERIHQLYPEAAERILAAFAQTRLTSFRVNTLKATIDDVQTALTNAGYQLEQLPWWENAFLLPNPEVQQIFHPLYEEGKFYVQGLSSMLPPLILNPQPGEDILDLTAAPGSKTTEIGALMQNQGHILANDLSPVRLFKLQANLNQQGVTIAQVKRGPGELLWRRFPEQFDRTLIDVPCSMEGRIQENDPKSYEDWSVKKIKELSMRQKMLLRSAISATKPGGTIVYSTCTLAPEENEAVVQWALEKEQGKVVLEEIVIPKLTDQHNELITPGITEWQGQHYSSELRKTLRIYPSEQMEGFYVAKLRKLEPTVTAELLNAPQPHRHYRRNSHRRRR
jgi:16S rRNA (cytosine1407-C5)-methyltransferase